MNVHSGAMSSHDKVAYIKQLSAVSDSFTPNPFAPNPVGSSSGISSNPFGPTPGGALVSNPFQTPQPSNPFGANPFAGNVATPSGNVFSHPSTGFPSSSYTGSNSGFQSAGVNPFGGTSSNPYMVGSSSFGGGNIFSSGTGPTSLSSNPNASVNFGVSMNTGFHNPFTANVQVQANPTLSNNPFLT